LCPGWQRAACLTGENLEDARWLDQPAQWLYTETLQNEIGESIGRVEDPGPDYRLRLIRNPLQNPTSL